jgi:hypothetical protein
MIVGHRRHATGSVPAHSGAPSGDAPVRVAAVTRAALTASAAESVFEKLVKPGPRFFPSDVWTSRSLAPRSA